MPEIRAKVACFGFRKRDWKKGETTNIGRQDKLPPNFEYTKPEELAKPGQKAEK